MNKFRNIPAIITLLAGFIVSVIMICQKYNLITFLWVLVLVMVVFYLAGIGIRILLNKTVADEEKKKASEEKEQEDQNNTEETAEFDDEELQSATAEEKKQA